MSRSVLTMDQIFNILTAVTPPSGTDNGIRNWDNDQTEEARR
jgi:hypothetical protein